MQRGTSFSIRPCFPDRRLQQRSRGPGGDHFVTARPESRSSHNFPDGIQFLLVSPVLRGVSVASLLPAVRLAIGMVFELSVRMCSPPG